VASVQLNAGALYRQAVYRFQLEQPATVSLFFVLPNLKSGPVEILLVGPDNFRNIFFHAPENFKGGGTVNPSNLALAAGEYEILMTFPQMNGQVDVGMK
jgi:hypothetical protein